MYFWHLTKQPEMLRKIQDFRAMWWVRKKKGDKANKKHIEPAQAACCSGSDPCCISAAAQRDQSSHGKPAALARGEAKDLNGSSTPWKIPEVTEGRNLEWEWRKGMQGKRTDQNMPWGEEQAAATSPRWMSGREKQGMLHPLGSGSHAICPEQLQTQSISLAIREASPLLLVKYFHMSSWMYRSLQRLSCKDGKQSLFAVLNKGLHHSKHEIPLFFCWFHL